MDLLNETIAAIQPQDDAWRDQATERLNQLTMPHWALGRLMDLAQDLAGMTRSMNPPVSRRVIVVMAGDHGIAAQGVSKFPQELTVQMMYNFVNGGAGINALARQSRTDVIPVDLGVAGDLSDLVESDKILDYKVAPGTADFSQGPAMSREQAVAALEAGIRIARKLGERYDVFGTGEMGIANTTPSAAVLAAITGCSVDDATGRGTGIDNQALKHKMTVIQQGLDLNEPDPKDGLDVLAKVGGFEIGGLAGLILGAAAQHKPVVVDGFISTAGALIANALCPLAVDYMITSHNSQEPGHVLMMEHLGKSGLLDLGFRLGEGTGAAVAMNLVEGAVHVLTGIATFEEAAVSKANEG